MDQTVKNHVSLKKVSEYSVIRKLSYQSWFLVYLQLPQARLLPPTTPSGQEIDHSDHHSAIESSESMDGQARRDLFTSETSEELLQEPTEIPKHPKTRITSRYGEARISGIPEWLQEFRESFVDELWLMSDQGDAILTMREKTHNQTKRNPREPVVF